MHGPTPESKVGFNRKWPGLVCIFLVLLIPLYALSLGPALMLVDAGLVEPQTMELVYRPLSVACSYLGVRPMMERYLEFWR